MSENELAGVTALVTGASRGFGQGIARCPGAGAHPGPGRRGSHRSGTGDDDGQAAYRSLPQA